MFKKFFRLMEEDKDLLDGGGGTPPVDDGGGAPPADDNGGSPPPTETPSVEFPEGLDDDIKEDPILQAYIKDGKLDQANIVKSLVHAKRMIGKDKAILPTEKSSPEEWKEFYSKMGLPELDKYSVEFDDKIVDTDFAEKFKAQAHELGILPNQANALMKFYEGAVNNSVTQMQEQSAARKAEYVKELKETYGDAFEKNLTVANNVLKDFGGEDFLGTLKEFGLQNNPNVIKTLVKIGEALGEDKIVEGPSANQSSIADLQEELSSLRAHPAYFDGDHAEHAVKVKRHNEIVDKLAKYGVSAF